MKVTSRQDDGRAPWVETPPSTADCLCVPRNIVLLLPCYQELSPLRDALFPFQSWSLQLPASPMITPLIGCGLLVLLAAFRVLPGIKRMPRWYSILVPLGLWLLAVNVWMPAPKTYLDSPAPGLVLKAKQKLDAQDLAGIQYVILVEGSSLTWNGFDGNRVETVLTEHGIPALVLQFSYAGANHPERYQFLKEFVRALRPDQLDALRRTKVILCREVEVGYDTNPLRGFLKNGSTGRSMRYLGPDNVPVVFSWLALKFGAIDWFKKHNLLTDLAGCGLFNLFHVGYVPRVQEPPPTAKTEPFLPNITQSPTFTASGSLDSVADAVVDRRSIANFSSNLPWQRKRDRDFREIFRGLVTSECYFTFPSWSKFDANYNAWKRRQSGNGLFFDGTNTQLVKELDKPALWYDQLHLQLPGAEIYSEAFAKYLIEQIESKSL
jgi:hypothetical protein